jgi:hypothetical protein
VPTQAEPDEVEDTFTFRSSLGSLGRHLVHGMAHLYRAADHDVDADQFDPEAGIEIPQQAFMDAAREFGGHFFTRLVQKDRTTSDVPPGVQTPRPTTTSR